jgi:hypothetical protein
VKKHNFEIIEECLEDGIQINVQNVPPPYPLLLLYPSSHFEHFAEAFSLKIG